MFVRPAVPAVRGRLRRRRRLRRDDAVLPPGIPLHGRPGMSGRRAEGRHHRLLLHAPRGCGAGPRGERLRGRWQRCLRDVRGRLRFRPGLRRRFAVLPAALRADSSPRLLRGGAAVESGGLLLPAPSAGQERDLPPGQRMFDVPPLRQMSRRLRHGRALPGQPQMLVEVQSLPVRCGLPRWRLFGGHRQYLLRPPGRQQGQDRGRMQS
mmetsp:Transcript_1464/g.4230  ORF Transcript_1464/g.4230 Transcript_1464/m.4230 type:complete len:208 (-) Transcript_1464:1226-1849(-)